jgi:PQQ-like domain
LAQASGLGGQLQVAWSAKLSGAAAYPVVAGDAVFVPTPGRITALSVLDGSKLWSAGVPGGGVALLAYDAGRLFAVSENSAGEFVESLSPTTGAREWITNRHVYEVGPPTALNGRVYVSFAGFDEATGSIVWNGSNDTSGADAVTPTGIYLPTTSGTYDDDPTTGHPIWAHRGGGGGGQNPIVVHDNKVYNGSDQSLSFDAASGAVRGAFASGATLAFDGSRMHRLDNDDQPPSRG